MKVLNIVCFFTNRCVRVAAKNISYGLTTESLKLDSVMQGLLGEFYKNTTTIPINTSQTVDPLRRYSNVTDIFNVTVKIDAGGNRISGPLDKPVYNQDIKSAEYEKFLASDFYPSDRVSYGAIDENYKLFKDQLDDSSINIKNDNRPLTEKLLENNIPKQVGNRAQWQRGAMGDHKTLFAQTRQLK